MSAAVDTSTPVHRVPTRREEIARVSASADQRGTILKYKADRLPLAFVLAAFALRLGFWAVATPTLALIGVIPLTIIGGLVAAINHHHQHVNTFRAAWANRFYEVVLALQTGISSYGWVLHHNFGHHVNYLNQRPHEKADESHWTRADGSQMGRFEYSLHLFLHHQFDIFRVGKKHPRYLRYYLWMKVPLWTLLGVMFFFRPLETVLVFWLPSMLALFETTWVTYEHHAGCEGNDHQDASRNRINALYNQMTGNLGYHTAHHTRPGLHWSLLPELHEKLRDGIPEEQILPKFW